MLRQKQKEWNRKIIIIAALIVIPLLTAIRCWRVASYETHQMGMKEYSRQIVEAQGEHRQEIINARSEYLSGLRGPDGLYHETNNF